MKYPYFKIISMAVVTAIFVSGCATARPRKAQMDENSQVVELQGQLQQKNLEIQDLQSQLSSRDRALPETQDYASSSKTSNIIHVAGVSISDVQQSLVRAGLNPGPVDGRAGSKTKKAIKAFQRRNNLHADGIVGEKTWALLR